IEAVGNCCETFGGSEHVLLVAAIKMNACDFFVVAGDEIALAAGRASKVMTAMPADSDALAFFPICDSGARFIDDTGHFMARNARILNAREDAVLCEVVAEANAAGLDFDANLSGAGLGDVALNDFKIAASLWNPDRFHFCHENLPFEGGFTDDSMRADGGAMQISSKYELSRGANIPPNASGESFQSVMTATCDEPE